MSGCRGSVQKREARKEERIRCGTRRGVTERGSIAEYAEA